MIEEEEQTISYYGVNDFFQNGRAEKKIRYLQNNGRTTLLHAIARWSQTVTTHLWPYALAHICNIDNYLSQDKIGVILLNYSTHRM